MLFTYISVTSLHGQEIIAQSNNVADLKQYESLIKATNISILKAKLENVIANNPDYKNTKLFIQITFFDPAVLGGLKLKTPHIHNTDYIDTWKNMYAAENRIMFFFEKQGGKYVFKDFVITNAIQEGQIPDIVRNYIVEQILKPEKEISELVYKGMNAVKNAYDRRFQQKLIEHAPKMLKCRYYYKGYTSITTYSYYFRNVTTNRHAELRLPIVYLHQGVYNAVHLKNWSETRANVFDNLIGHELLSINNTTPQADLLYTQDGTVYRNLSISNLSFDTKDLFDYSRTGHSTFENVVRQPEFGFVETLKNSKTIMTMDLSNKKQLTAMQQNGLTIPISHNTLYKLIKDTIHGPTASNLYNGEDNAQADSISAAQLWGHPFWSGYPTWCNVYAQYLSRHIYGQVNGDYLVPSQGGTMNANRLFDYFNSSPHYKSLNKDNPEEIWEFINKGYPVYFSKSEVGKSGHIETGFPANIVVNIWNGKIFGQENSNVSILNATNNKLVIGAGGTVGFKSYDKYNWIKNDKTRAFLALQYLNNVYD